jgi:hypothetical protein
MAWTQITSAQCDANSPVNETLMQLIRTNFDHIFDGTDIGTGLVTADSIAAGAVGQSEIADDAVGAGEIIAGAVGQSEIADNAVGAGELIDTATATSVSTSTTGATTWNCSSMTAMPRCAPVSGTPVTA